MHSNLKPSERLIVALDVNTGTQARELIDRLGDSVGFYKVGWQLFIREGIAFVRELAELGKRVFLDLKMGDIEETIRSALNNLPGDHVELLTIHGNGATVEAARKGRNGREKPYLLMVTFLSSQDDVDLQDLFATSNLTVEKYVKWKAEKSLDAGCEGLIASGDSVRQLRGDFPERQFLIVAPGIRPKGSPTDDHKRFLTPYQAIVDGADYLVVGRPIRSAPDPREMAEQIIEDISKGREERERLTASHDSHKDDFVSLLNVPVSG